ncbi:MAG: fibrobacter succinogenes major paralogous domain-containing protein, partial [Candidatus Zixiibacteriota bacterium]
GDHSPDGSCSSITDDEPKSADTVFDIDGNAYTTVTIGTQVWLAENLRVTRCRNGHKLPYVSDDTAWSTCPGGAYCWYNDDSTTTQPFGALYNFEAAVESCGLCPEGWHVPTESEWLSLIAFLGGDEIAGGKLKEEGAVHWRHPNIGATDESGFHGLPEGGRGQISGCGEIGEYATWWSSTPYDSTYAWHYGLYRRSAKMRYNPGHRASGFSIRCIKD